MAGIGFTLRKALGEAERYRRWKLYGAASFVAAGPWLLTLLSLFLILMWGMAYGMGQGQRDLFFATVTYCMIGSNLISSTAQFFLTRYLADALYVDAPQRLLSAFSGVFAYTGVAAVALFGGFQALLPLPMAYKVWTVLLAVVLTQMGLTMILLSAARAYRDIARGFLFGLLVIAVVLFGYTFWLHGQGETPSSTAVLALFTGAEVLTLIRLGRVVVRDFPGDVPSLYGVKAHHRRYPQLLWIGLFYALTLWVDNSMRWLSPEHVTVAGSYWLQPSYDLAKFWTFLALIPAFTLFSVHIETDFYQVFRRFYDAIESGETLAIVRVQEEDLRTATKTALMRMAKLQSVVALIAWVLAQQVKSRYPDVIDVFQWTIIGSIPHMLWITAFLLLLYFDARKQAVWSVIVTVLALLCGVSVAMAFGWSPGSGYLVGCVIALGVTLLQLSRQTDRLLFYAFHDPNGGRRRKGLPPAVQATKRQQRVGYPVLHPEVAEQLREQAVPWEPGMKLPPRRERHGRHKEEQEE
ncbi:MAG TPA: exopolysaccharide Pel transporter PelG [Bacilli bacterium]|nr:exopolysaccharide Pel transporter PelG [Bacilli bacterium]